MGANAIFGDYDPQRKLYEEIPNDKTGKIVSVATR